MYRAVLCVVIACWLGAAAALAVPNGILADRVNQVVIEGDFSVPSPDFLLIFSSEPIRDARGGLAGEVVLDEFESGPDRVAIRVGGKKAAKPGRFEYSFGTAADADMPWNTGSGFDWHDWEKLSPDIWDNLCVAVLPGDMRQATRQAAVVKHVTIRKGGQLLYNSHAKQSYPNKRHIQIEFPPANLAARGTKIPVLNLAERMTQFRKQYYELGNSRLLELAYSDLGQTGKRKYAKRGANWCSEFASYIYRQNQLMTPDPDEGDVHWKNLRAFFEENGKVYAAREVAAWPNAKKINLIKPGSFVSIPIGDTTHSIIFTNWVTDGAKPITRYVGISGNNKGMVWSHAPQKLPEAAELAQMTAEQLAEFDQKVYFGVPEARR